MIENNGASFLGNEPSALPCVPVQGSLFSEFEQDLLTLEQPETRKRYTAASLEKRLEVRNFIVRCLAEGWGLLRIARAAGVSHHLVSKLRDSRPELVAIEKKELSGQIGRILKMSADKFEEALERGMVPAGQIPVAFGIFADKKAMLDGDAGLVIEHRHTIQGTVEGFKARLAAAVDLSATETTPIDQQKGLCVDVQAVPDTDGHALGPGSGPVPGSSPGEAEGGGGATAGGVPSSAPMDRRSGAEEQKT